MDKNKEMHQAEHWVFICMAKSCLFLSLFLVASALFVVACINCVESFAAFIFSSNMTLMLAGIISGVVMLVLIMSSWRTAHFLNCRSQNLGGFEDEQIRIDRLIEHHESEIDIEDENYLEEKQEDTL